MFHRIYLPIIVDITYVRGLLHQAFVLNHMGCILTDLILDKVVVHKDRLFFKTNRDTVVALFLRSKYIEFKREKVFKILYEKNCAVFFPS